MSSDDDTQRIESLVNRYAPKERRKGILDDAVSFYDFFNVVTGLANLIENTEERQRLQFEGGAMLERFI